MSKPAFAIGDVLKAGWAGFKKNAKFLIVPIILIFALVIVFYTILFAMHAQGMLYHGMIGSAPAMVLVRFFIIYIIYLLIAIYLGLSLLRTAIDTAKGKKLSWDILHNDIGYYFRYLLTIILFCVVIFVIPALLLVAAIATHNVAAGILICFVAFVLCIILMFLFSPVIFFAADKEQKTDFVGFFTKSYQIVTKNLGQLILYTLALIGIFILAVIVLAIVLSLLAVIVLLASRGNHAVTIITMMALYLIGIFAIYILVGLPIYVSTATVYKKLVYPKKR